MSVRRQRWSQETTSRATPATQEAAEPGDCSCNQKAFDSVSHNSLLSKLQNLGISGKLWTWLETHT